MQREEEQKEQEGEEEKGEQEEQEGEEEERRRSASGTRPTRCRCCLLCPAPSHVFDVVHLRSLPTAAHPHARACAPMRPRIVTIPVLFAYILQPLRPTLLLYLFQLELQLILLINYEARFLVCITRTGLRRMLAWCEVRPMSDFEILHGQ